MTLFSCLLDLRVRLSVFAEQLSIFPLLLWIRGTIAREEKKMPQDVSKGPSSERNTGQSNQNLSFRCSDAGQSNCNWQASGKSEDELLPKIEQHAREVHHMNMDENTRSKVRGAIRQQAA